MVHTLTKVVALATCLLVFELPARVAQAAEEAVSVPQPGASSYYELVGHGYCVDAAGSGYEQWYVPDWQSKSLIYTGHNLSKCTCPECFDVCDRFWGCAGFQYFCCPWGESCFGGGAVLFTSGRRPRTPPPGNFTLIGPRNTSTSGLSFSGRGAIISATAGREQQFCFRKMGHTLQGYIYEPHTLEGTTKTIEGNANGCQLRCQNVPECVTWGFWPDHGCHLQGKGAKLVKVNCDGGADDCDGAHVISGGLATPRPDSRAISRPSETWKVVPALTPVVPPGSSQMVTAGVNSAEANAGGESSAQAGGVALVVGDDDVAAQSDGVALMHNAHPSSAELEMEEDDFHGARGFAVFALILVLVALALYLTLQEGLAKKRFKRKSLKERQKRRERKAAAAALAAEGGECAWGQSGDLGWDRSESEEEALKRKMLDY